MAASRQLQATQADHTARLADTQKAHEVAQRFCGWEVFSARHGTARIATRIANQKPPPGDDDIWAATVIGDTWDELEEKLAEQVQHDAERACEQPA